MKQQTIARQIGEGVRGLRTFMVSEEMVVDCQEWSAPVQFKFEEREDGKVEMILRSVDSR